jgi:hypothetical protein
MHAERLNLLLTCCYIFMVHCFIYLQTGGLATKLGLGWTMDLMKLAHLTDEVRHQC